MPVITILSRNAFRIDRGSDFKVVMSGQLISNFSARYQEMCDEYDFSGYYNIRATIEQLLDPDMSYGWTCIAKVTTSPGDLEPDEERLSETYNFYIYAAIFSDGTAAVRITPQISVGALSTEDRSSNWRESAWQLAFSIEVVVRAVFGSIAGELLITADDNREDIIEITSWNDAITWLPNSCFSMLHRSLLPNPSPTVSAADCLKAVGAETAYDPRQEVFTIEYPRHTFGGNNSQDFDLIRQIRQQMKLLLTDQGSPRGNDPRSESVNE